MTLPELSTRWVQRSSRPESLLLETVLLLSIPWWVPMALLLSTLLRRIIRCSRFRMKRALRVCHPWVSKPSKGIPLCVFTAYLIVFISNHFLTCPHRSGDHSSRDYYRRHNPLPPSRPPTTLVPTIFGESSSTADNLRRIWRSWNLCSQACSCFKHPPYHCHRRFKLLAPWSITRQFQRRRTSWLPRRSWRHEETGEGKIKW